MDEPIDDSPSENIIIKFKLSDIKPKPQSLEDSESEQYSKQPSQEDQEEDDNPSNYSYQSNDNNNQSSSSELHSFEQDLQNNLKCREQEMLQQQDEEQIQEKIEKRVKTDQETKQSNSLLYSHDKHTNQKNQKRQYQKQNQHIKESYVDLPVSKERQLQLSLESAQKFQQKLLYTNIIIRPFIKAIEENQEKADEMTSKEGFPANSIPFLIYNSNNNSTRYYSNGALQAQQTTVEKFINLNTQGDKDGFGDKMNFPGPSYLGYSNFMRKRRKRRSHAQILSDNQAKLLEESRKMAHEKEQQQLQQQFQAQQNQN